MKAAAGFYTAKMLLLITVLMIAPGKGFFLDGKMAVTQRGESDDKHGGFHGTPDTGRDLPLVTTAPPFTDLNHHFQFKTISQPDPHYQSQGMSKDSREMDHHLFKALSAQPVPHEDAAAFSDMATGSFFAHDAKLAAERLKQSEAAGETQGQSFEELSTESLTTSIVPSSDPPPCNTAPGEQLGSPHAATTQETEGVTTLVMRKEEEQSKTREKRKGPNIEASAVTVSGDQDDETTTTTIFTTTIITTIQTPAPCSINFTAPGGYIETPPQGSCDYSTFDCTYTVSVYMGYGVEIQVINVSLAEGDSVRFEDLGGHEPSVLANESILMKGLVVRSYSNQISVHFHSRRPCHGSFLLLYQAFVLSCNFPERPAYGDVTVSSLHAGGEAYFYCFTGYQIQGPSTLTCLNATTPHWNGKEPRCLAACGGLIKNASLGRIVSPGFPSNYSNNLTCHWVLEAPEGQRLHVHFEKVALAEDDDRLLIKNGNNIDSATLYDSYEVEYLPNEGIVSTSRYLFIEFTTDGSGTNTGAAIRYEAFALGHCYEPFVKYGNFTSSDNSYGVGAVVEFSCNSGYTLEQGSVIIECMDPKNPQWNETEPACRAVCSGEITDSAGVVLSPNWPEAYDKGQDCIWGIHVEEDKRIMLDIQILHMGTNDLLTFYDGDDLTAKALGQYSGSRPRFKLYTSTADVTIQFQSDPATNVYGYNNGFVVHFFEVPRNDTCPELPEITNGWKTTSHPELVHGTVVTYQCYPGFEVVGTEMLMCQWDLTWSGDLPTCERVLSCPDPGMVEHSHRVMSGPRLIVGSTVQYICNKGYSLSGNSLLSCYKRDSTGPKWSEKPPKCIPDTYEACRNPGIPAFGIQLSEKQFYQAGEILHFSCLSGYKLIGEANIRCVPSRPSKWSHPLPVCKAAVLVYVNERRLDVARTDFSMEGANVVFTIFIPVAIVMLIVTSIYFYISRVQGKTFRLPMSTSPQYDQIRGETAFENPIYETAKNSERVIIAPRHQRFFPIGYCCNEKACKES
ncbi:seizure protein 6 homolog isoform X1 [Tachysurus fulvidraco]|uniref:seizure protein 6 homolog isoform X1 n=1 Tax=Tachysurus fulvidraco TaxID=1234273 RepID=UPI000F4DF9B7|nr:seizure protein 6 homolog isoform X1 [Tachysurus fulvidraco]XP_027003612.1 seizure protein 6 homolog isoform X1 [Tachysurus fulvidraco]